MLFLSLSIKFKNSFYSCLILQNITLIERFIASVNNHSFENKFYQDSFESLKILVNNNIGLHLFYMKVTPNITIDDLPVNLNTLCQIHYC